MLVYNKESYNDSTKREVKNRAHSNICLIEITNKSKKTSFKETCLGIHFSLRKMSLETFFQYEKSVETYTKHLFGDFFIRKMSLETFLIY